MLFEVSEQSKQKVKKLSNVRYGTFCRAQDSNVHYISFGVLSGWYSITSEGQVAPVMSSFDCLVVELPKGTVFQFTSEF